MTVSEQDSDEETDNEMEGCQDFDVSVREVDEKEARLIDLFIDKGCNCSLGPNRKPCSQVLSRDNIVSTRNSCIEMSSNELDMLILANLDAHRHQKKTVPASNCKSSHTDNISKRGIVDYYSSGNRVCKDTFLFIHAIGPKRYKNLVAHFDKNGLVS